MPVMAMKAEPPKLPKLSEVEAKDLDTIIEFVEASNNGIARTAYPKSLSNAVLTHIRHLGYDFKERLIVNTREGGTLGWEYLVFKEYKTSLSVEEVKLWNNTN